MDGELHPCRAGAGWWCHHEIQALNSRLEPPNPFWSSLNLTSSTSQELPKPKSWYLMLVLRSKHAELSQLQTPSVLQLEHTRKGSWLSSPLSICHRML